MAGYTRQSISDILNGLPITAPPLTAEFNQIDSAFDATTGHSHDGGIGNAPPIALPTSVSGYLPAVNGGTGGRNKVDATTAPSVTNDANQGYVPGSHWLNSTDGRVYVCVGNGVGSAVWRETALITETGIFFPKTNDTVDLGTAANRFRSLFLSGGMTMVGNAAVGGSLTVVGAIAASGGVNGNVAGNVTGNLTGNVTAATGTSVLNNLTVNGLVDFTNTKLSNVAAPVTDTDGATKLYVDQTIAAVLDSAPGTLNTLNELAAALGDDPDFATTVTNDIATKLPKAGGTMTGNITMGGNKVTGLAAPTTGTDAVNLTYTSTLYGSTASAAVSAASAEAWADKAENLEVETGKFSSKHHALKAATSATNASTSESNAASSAGAASTSASNAGSSAGAASTSETNAGNSASAASSSASAASTSKTSASASATAASNSASSAATSETNAATSRTNASTSAGAAATSASAAAASFDSFDDRYLGAKSSNPSVDNDGNALLVGALYFNTTVPEMRVRSAGAWLSTDYNPDLVDINGGAIDGTVIGGTAPAAGSFTSISTTGNVSFGDNGKAIFGAGSDLQIYHDGSTSIIEETGSGDFRLKGQNIDFKDAANKTYAYFNQTSGSATLYHSGVSKISTNSSGIYVDGKVESLTAQIAGTVTAGSLTVSGDITATGGDLNLDTLNLTAIAASKAVTATDVFVYDTSKDTDGGAWRKRTQGTSWYNEALNTATRGSRKEFPAVAVIVAENSKVTIYDGDDPSLPMWMVFNASTSAQWLQGSSKTVSSLVCLNGGLGIGFNGAGGSFAIINLITDTGEELITAAHPWHKVKNGIVGRNTDGTILGTGTTIGTKALVNRTINDVAMTVLPDAPIDPATGLQIPTIAVATNGGLSIIKDNGTVANLASSTGAGGYEVYDTWFDTHNNLYAIHSYDNSNYGIATLWGFYAETLRQVQDASQNQGNGEINWGYSGRATSLPIVKGDKASTDGWVMKGGTATGQQEIAIIGNGFLSQAQLDLNNFTKGLVNYTAASYTSGWMPGDIKGAFLADTDTTSLVGSGELVTNGRFDTGITDWTPSGNGSLSVVDGRLRVTNDSATNASAYQALTTVVGVRYVLSLEQTQISSRVLVGTASGNGNILAGGFTTGTNLFSFIAVTTTTILTLQSAAGSAGQFSDFDNVSVKLADADRSVNNKGLTVNGTVTRTPVATGAELVGYSGFSGTSFLEQPYNAGLDFGTGDFSTMGWVNLAAGAIDYRWIIDGIDAADTEGFAWYTGPNGVVVFRTKSSAGISDATGATVVEGTGWAFVCTTRESAGTRQSVYINGKLDVSATVTARTISGTNAPLRIGTRQSASAAFFQGSLALLRISATAPSPAQIAKIYRDELPLFQAGAACTLYGTSDAVTALAHDPVTDLLHVGTSAGRSVFDGLRRVSNTTVAVGTAISASNNLIVEE
jgi:hypothetical protein